VIGPEKGRRVPGRTSQERVMKVVRTGETPWTEAVKRGDFQQRRKGLGG
jgi:hypothetical protein